LKPGSWMEVGRMDQLGRLDTPVHRTDARAKTITTVGFLIAVMSFDRYQVSALTPFFLYPVALMAVGGIPPGYILRRMLVAAPFAIAIAAFNPLLDHRPVAMVGSHEVTGGWMSFASIMVRFALTVSTALVLIASTGIHRFCAGLERLGLPQVFSVQILFLYRYLFVVADEGSRMLRSVELRSAGKRSLRLRAYGGLVGHLLLRSMDRAQRVYRAMVSRGFNGEIRLMHRLRVRRPDVAFVIGWMAFFIVARFWNLAAWLGRLATGGRG
jgi:cobalt/nickel transport system permease protein